MRSTRELVADQVMWHFEQFHSGERNPHPQFKFARRDRANVIVIHTNIAHTIDPDEGTEWFLLPEVPTPSRSSDRLLESEAFALAQMILGTGGAVITDKYITHNFAAGGELTSLSTRSRDGSQNHESTRLLVLDVTDAYDAVARLSGVTPKRATPPIPNSKGGPANE